MPSLNVILGSFNDFLLRYNNSHAVNGRPSTYKNMLGNHRLYIQVICSAPLQLILISIIKYSTSPTYRHAFMENVALHSVGYNKYSRVTLDIKNLSNVLIMLLQFPFLFLFRFLFLLLLQHLLLHLLLFSLHKIINELQL